MEVNLENKPFGIFGLKGSGKTYLAMAIAARFGSLAIVYDTLHEYPESEDFDIYRPKERNNVKEAEAFVRLVMKGGKYRLLVVDECNRYCPSKPAPLPQAFADLNDWHRHYHLSWGFIARRPTQLNQDLTELADYLFLFNLPGKNDVAYLNEIADNLGDTVRDLPTYHFVIVNKQRQFEVHKPLPVVIEK